MYKRGVFVFDFKVPKTYPHDPPKVQCETTVFHPNIDMEGHVCLNILREDWKPVLTIQSVIMGLQVAATRLHLGLRTSAPRHLRAALAPLRPAPPPPTMTTTTTTHPPSSRLPRHKPHPTPLLLCLGPAPPPPFRVPDARAQRRRPLNKEVRASATPGEGWDGRGPAVPGF